MKGEVDMWGLCVSFVQKPRAAEISFLGSFFCCSSGLALEMAMSVCRSTTLVQAEISQQLLDGLPLNLAHISMVPRGLIIMILVIYFYCSEISLYLTDGLAKKIVQTFSVPRGWTMTLVIPWLFLLAPPWGQIFILPTTLVYDQMPALLMTFPSSSAVRFGYVPFSKCYHANTKLRRTSAS